ncbi:MAG: polysaccharide lyase 6 family protein [Ferruginibacter sp.]
MLKTILLNCLLLFSLFAAANTIPVKNIEELKKANKEALPGDIIVLQNGEWNNVTMALNCIGTTERPITFKAETAGKVFITGNSKLQLGGSFIVIDGFYFTRGYAGSDAIINFRINSKQLANNCRVTNTVINDFNNPKRMDENYWVSLSGKNNRIDHCSFLNKKNMGVLMAVILDDERSRENFHSIDHNYFGVRLPLASNSGEIIRVGVSQHCEFNSNTQITDNFFEHCDGETEIISIKSCRNYVRNNLFKECQGSVVLRHGNYNTVENNIFLGNDKEGTGGVRVINKGQWVVNNLFYKCRGEWFRSPLSIMNGVPNSPAFRYVAVTDAVIANNSFFECTPIGIGIGSDTERSVPPKQVQFINNIFYNHSDDIIYNAYDDISGISFSGNLVSSAVKQDPVAGFHKSNLQTTKVDDISIPATGSVSKNDAFHSLYKESKTRLANGLSTKSGFADGQRLIAIENNAKKDCGAQWFTKLNITPTQKTTLVNCKTPEELKAVLAANSNKAIKICLTGDSYTIDEPLSITGNVSITSNKKKIKFVNNSNGLWPYLVEIKAGNTLSLVNIDLDLSGLGTNSFISADINGSSNHSNFSVSGCNIKNMTGNFFNAVKSTVFDSIVINNNSFTGNKGMLFNFGNETDKKGYYSVEKLKITGNSFNGNEGQLLNILRGGNDESTMGPYIIFTNNRIENCVTANDDALIHLFGAQRSVIESNNFKNCNTGKPLIEYEDLVRAVHLLRNNSMVKSGSIVSNKFVNNTNNVVR